MGIEATGTFLGPINVGGMCYNAYLSFGQKKADNTRLK